MIDQTSGKEILWTLRDKVNETMNFFGGGGDDTAAVNSGAAAANKRSRVNKPSHALSPGGPMDVGRRLAALKTET